MAKLTKKPFDPSSGMIKRDFKGFPAYFTKPDLDQYFDSIEYNLDKLNKLAMGDVTGSVILKSTSSWNTAKTEFTLSLGITKDFILHFGKLRVPIDESSFNYVDVKKFDGKVIDADSDNKMVAQVSNVVLLGTKKITSFGESPLESGVTASDLTANLESSDVIKYENFSLSVVTGVNLPETIDGKDVLCVVAQATFYFDGYWKPFVVNNFRADKHNLDVATSGKFPLVGKFLSAFGTAEMYAHITNILNNKSLKIDGSNDAVADLFINKAGDGRFKLVSEQDYASTTKPGIVRLANATEAKDVTNNLVALTPFGYATLNKTVRYTYNLGKWNIKNSRVLTFKHNIPEATFGGDLSKLVVVSCSIVKDSKDKSIAIFSDNYSEISVNKETITITIGEQSIFNSDAYTVLVENRGTLILDVVVEAELTALEPPTVSTTGPGTLTMADETKGTPTIRKVVRQGTEFNYTDLFNINVELGKGTTNNVLYVEFIPDPIQHNLASASYKPLANSPGGANASREIKNVKITRNSYDNNKAYDYYRLRCYILTKSGVKYVGNSITIYVGDANLVTGWHIVEDNVYQQEFFLPTYEDRESKVSGTFKGTHKISKGTLKSESWSVIKGNESGVVLKSDSKGVAVYDFLEEGEWTMQYKVVISNGANTAMGTSTQVAKVKATAIQIPKATITFMDGSTGTQKVVIKDKGEITFSGSSMGANFVAVAHEFSYRTSKKDGVTQPNFYAWRTDNISVIQSTGVGTLKIEEDLGVVEIRYRAQDKNGNWTQYSNTITANLDYSLAIREMEAKDRVVEAFTGQKVGLYYQPDWTGAYFYTLYATADLFIRVKGVIDNPNIETIWQSTLSSILYDPNNFYNRTPYPHENYNVRWLFNKENFKVLDDVFDTSTVTGVKKLTEAIATAMREVNYVNPVNTKTEKYYYEVKTDYTPKELVDFRQPDGSFLIRLQVTVGRGTMTANKDADYQNPPSTTYNTRVVCTMRCSNDTLVLTPRGRGDYDYSRS